VSWEPIGSRLSAAYMGWAAHSRISTRPVFPGSNGRSSSSGLPEDDPDSPLGAIADICSQLPAEGIESLLDVSLVGSCSGPPETNHILEVAHQAPITRVGIVQAGHGMFVHPRAVRTKATELRLFPIERLKTGGSVFGCL